MEILTIITTIIISFLSSGGFLLNTILDKTIESKLKKSEELELRVYNVPTHNILKGKVQKIRFASRGVQPIENVRIEVLEIETDAIDIDFQGSKIKSFNDLKDNLRKPLQAGIRLVFTEKDLNNALQSSQIQSYIQKIISENENNNFKIHDLSVNLKENDHIEIETKIQVFRKGQEENLKATLEFGLEVIKGSKIKIVDPMGTLNGKRLSRKLLQSFIDNINPKLDLQILETKGITLRFLEFAIDDHKINMAAYVHINDNISN